MSSSIKTVLLVEDSDDDAFFFKRAWKKTGLFPQVVHVRDGMEAQAFLQSALQSTPSDASALPKVIISDLKMPWCGGLEFLRWLRSQPELQHLPCVILSSSPAQIDIDHAYQAGANSYMVKPTDPQASQGLLHMLRFFAGDRTAR